MKHFTTQKGTQTFWLHYCDQCSMWSVSAEESTR